MNTTTKRWARKDGRLPRSSTGLVKMMPPLAIQDDAHHKACVEVIDRLMRIDNLSQGQSEYLETLVELVEAYERRHHAIDVSGLSGVRMLQHVLEESGMNASELARVLGVHASMGSKILKGQRQLTWGHAKVLGEKFKVSPVLFMES